MIQIYAMESALLRTKKRLKAAGEQKCAAAVAMTRVFVCEAFEKIESLAKETLSAIESGDMLRTQLSMLKKLTRRTPVNTIALKRQVAALVAATERFVC